MNEYAATLCCHAETLCLPPLSSCPSARWSNRTTLVPLRSFFYVSRVPTAGVILDLEREGISQASLTTHQLCNLIIATALPSKKLECLSHSRRLMGLWSSGPPSFTLRVYSRFLMTFLVRRKYIPSLFHSFISLGRTAATLRTPNRLHFHYNANSLVTCYSQTLPKLARFVVYFI